MPNPTAQPTEFPRVFELRECRYGRMLFPRRDPYVGRSLDLYGEFSQGEADLFQALLAPGQVVVEVGANIGAHTVLLARIVGETGLVLAFEPQRRLHQVLCANLALNGIPNVIAEQVALGRTEGTAQVPPLDYGADLNFGGLALDQAHEGEAVPVRPLDAYRLPDCAFLKVDVEGMEAQVLAGAETLLRSHRPLVYVENDRKDKALELMALLRSFGYRLWWHNPPLFNPANFRGVAENVFSDLASRNMLGVPGERPVPFPALADVPEAEGWPFLD